MSPNCTAQGLIAPSQLIDEDIYSSTKIVDLSYKVGALLYAPASNISVADNICHKKIATPNSLALCLEDAIMDDSVSAAENLAITSLTKLYNNRNGSLPLLFVRVRSPIQALRLVRSLGEVSDVLCGFIFLKFDMANAAEYLEVLNTLNAMRTVPFFAMPILETVVDVEKRVFLLNELKKMLDFVSSHILNIRVGGNDFCNIFGVRRSVTKTIYDIGVVRDILSDIINIFRDYVVSAPVWEYFAGDGWVDGLRRELELDALNGFIGKTAIHPVQIPIIQESLMVSREDYDDALQILQWSDNVVGVAKTASGRRMNEVKAHLTWAKKVAILAESYGVKQ